jgi:hypothetical protein
MGHSDNQEYDVFIAYYGNSTTGSENSARQLYGQLNNLKIGPDRFVRVYFHPVVNPIGSYENTPNIVARTPMFVLVADKGIPRTPQGQLIEYREDGTRSNLFDEVYATKNTFGMRYGRRNNVKVFLSDDMSFKEAEDLHASFIGTTALSSFRDVREWVYHYLENEPQTILDEYQNMAIRDPERFMRGQWLDKVKTAWLTFRDQRVARILMIYYIAKIEKGDSTYLPPLKELYQQVAKMRYLDSKTRDTLLRAQQTLG